MFPTNLANKLRSTVPTQLVSYQCIYLSDGNGSIMNYILSIFSHVFVRSSPINHRSSVPFSTYCPACYFLCGAHLLSFCSLIMEGGDVVNGQDTAVDDALEEKLCQLIISEDHPAEELGVLESTLSELSCSAGSTFPVLIERYSRKVFVGGLPPDIDEDGIISSFQRFGPLIVDWPYKAQCRSYFPPKGYAFLLFENEKSVEGLVKACVRDDDRLQFWVSSPSISHKAVQIRPWKLSDNDYVLDRTVPVDPRKTVFVGGLPRTLSAAEVAQIMTRLYGTVCYAGIDTDPELRYPKGTASVAFTHRDSYIEAIKTRFVTLRQDGRKCSADKRVEIKPYIWDDQNCDNCQATELGNVPAHFFCSNISCLRYYCLDCWLLMHARPDIKFHSPDYIRRMSSRWS